MEQNETIRQEEMLSYLCEEFPDSQKIYGFGQTSILRCQREEIFTGVCFCIISNSSEQEALPPEKPPVLALSFMLPRAIYEEQFGAPELARARNPAALNKLQPHPRLAAAGWVQILSPTKGKFKQMRSFIKESYLLARVPEQTSAPLGD